MNLRQSRVAHLCNGVLSSREIAALLNERQKYVQEVMLKFDLPRRKIGSASGAENGSYVCGRRITQDGYVLTSAPENHPYARSRKDRHTKIILEHRLVLEKKLGRYLLPTEIVDHVDGLRLHNDPSNLRLFQSNSEHLKETISGQRPAWSEDGFCRMKTAPALRKESQPVHIYNQMKAAGDVRLQEILLAMLKLGKDSPFLLGSSRHLEKKQIYDLSRQNLILELDKLYQKYA